METHENKGTSGNGASQQKAKQGTTRKGNTTAGRNAQTLLKESGKKYIAFRKKTITDPSSAVQTGGLTAAEKNQLQ
jgi:hypothetical protein